MHSKLNLSIGNWNCGKGLLDENNFGTEKVGEIQAFIELNNLDILAVGESGLHRARSRTIKTYPATDEIIKNALRIPGFDIILPNSWSTHETARIILYIKNSITFKYLSSQDSISDLPVISIEARKGKGPKTIVSAHYREFMGGVSGLKTLEAQQNRLSRLLDHWAYLDSFNLDTVIIGDTNLCFSKWGTQNNPQQTLIDKVKDSQANLALQQLVNTATRIQSVNNVVEKSIIDHVYTNCSHMIPETDVQPVGSSDHLGLVVNKYSKFQPDNQRSFRVRNYSGQPHLLQAILENKVNELVANCNNLDEANETFKKEILYYANKFTPIKTITPKKNRKPFLKPETMQLINAKSETYKKFKTSGLAEDLDLYKELTKDLKKAINKDRSDWLSED